VFFIHYEIRIITIFNPGKKHFNPRPMEFVPVNARYFLTLTQKYYSCKLISNIAVLFPNVNQRLSLSCNRKKNAKEEHYDE